MTKTADGLYEVNLRPHGSHEKLLTLLGDRRRVLDVGCSTGYLAERLQERGRRWSGSSSTSGRRATRAAFCEAVHVGDVETMELPLEPASFDAVVCGDFIEHLRDPRAFLARVRPLLRREGRLVLSTPNVANWAMRLGLLFGRFRYTEWGILDRTHTHLFTRKTLKECLEAAGYRVSVLRLHRPGAGALDAPRGGACPLDRTRAPVAPRVPVRRRRRARSGRGDRGGRTARRGRLGLGMADESADRTDRRARDACLHRLRRRRAAPRIPANGPVGSGGTDDTELARCRRHVRRWRSLHQTLGARKEQAGITFEPRDVFAVAQLLTEQRRGQPV